MDAYLLHSRPTGIVAPAPPTTSVVAMSRITREELAEFLLASPSTSEEASKVIKKSSPLASITRDELAIVDVRDSDYIGGHIRSCIHSPSANLEWKLPELARQLWDKKVVVFHCALSQQRGPLAAAKYAKERERQGRRKFVMEDSITEATPTESGTAQTSSQQQQKVVVLEGGFVMWQEKYGMDDRITEGYAKCIWEESFY